MTLIVINYSMSPRSLTFGHQRAVVEMLSRTISKIIVITADCDIGPPIQGVEVISTRWVEGKKTKSVFRFISVALKTLIRLRLTDKRITLFSHMTDLQSCLLAVPCKVLRIKHVLWYAHKSHSFYLRFSSLFVDKMITSTKGSFPINSNRVSVIGQAIDSLIFTNNFKSYPSHPPLRWYSLGRIDPSKNLEIIISVFSTLRDEGWNLSLDIFGAPSSLKFERYANSLLHKFSQDTFLGWLNFKGRIENSRVPFIASEYDGFIHAFEGSLDKVLIEATMARRVVITNNQEYLEAFDIQRAYPGNAYSKLLLSMKEALNEKIDNQELEIRRRFSLAESEHSLQSWVIAITEILFEE